MIKRITARLLFVLFFSVTLFSASLVVNATPGSALWERAVLLGFDEQSYYCLIVKKNQPGSHYQDTDYLYFSHFKNNGDLINSILIREIHNTIDPDDNNAKPKHLDKTVKAFDFQTFLQKNKVQLAFPSTAMDEFKTSFGEKGLFIEKNNRKVLLLKAVFLDKYFNHYKKQFSDHFKLVGFYENNESKMGYFLIKVGDGSGDMDLTQRIVPVQLSEIRPFFDKSYFRDKKNN